MKNNQHRFAATVRYAGAGLLAAALIFAAGCNAVDLSKISVTLWPGNDGDVINSGDSVWVEFSDEVRHPDAEAATSLKTFSGSVEYDVSWDGRRMILMPPAGWRAGAAYDLRCEGTVSSEDGRSFDICESVRFFAVTSAAPPVLLGQSPANDAVVSRKAALTLTFSKPLDPQQIRRYVTTSPSCDVAATLSTDGTILTIAPVDQWEGLTRYQWTVGDDLADTAGIPLKEEYRGSFRVQEDTTTPSKPGLTAVDPDDISLELTLDAIQKDSGLLFRFSEPIDAESLAKQLAVTPDATVTVREIDGATFMAYRTDSAWASGTEYTVTLGKGLADVNGNLTAEDFTWTFTPPYEPLTVLSITYAPNGTNETFEGPELASPDPLPIGVSSGTSDLTFIIQFSDPVSASETARLVDALTIKRVFPLSASDPDIAAMLSLGDSKVSILVRGLSVPGNTANGERVIYKLTIKGGKSGFTLDAGNSLENDFIVYLETISS